MRRSPPKTAIAVVAFAVVAFGALVVAPAGCGRTQLQPWGSGADGGGPSDVASETSDGSPDLPPDGGAGDVALLTDGGQTGNDAADADMGLLACGGLQPLIDKGPITTRRTRDALFTSNGRKLLLRVAGEGGATSDDLLGVALPSGDVTMVAQAITNAEWLGSTGRLLLTHPGAGALTALALDGTFVRALSFASCEHAIASDGARVLALHDCDAAGTGVLTAIDVATGTTTTLSTAAAAHTLTVSPDGQWVAYQTGAATDGGMAVGIVHVVDRGNADYALDYLAGTRRLAFTPANKLLFTTSADASTLAVADIYVHAPGSSKIALRVAQSRNVGPGGYHVSPDGALLLAARFPPAQPMLDELYAVHLDGSGETLLASNLAPYQFNQIGPSVFAFSADGGRAVYTSNNFSGTASVSVAGGTITPLASGASFAISPAGDRIAVVDRGGTSDTLHLVDAVTNLEMIAFDGTAMRGLGFVPNGGGLLFVELPSGAPQRLRQFKFGGSSITTLAEWSTSRYWAPQYPVGELPASAGYPTDPTGCYAVVDSDSAPAGSRLVLLP